MLYVLPLYWRWRSFPVPAKRNKRQKLQDEEGTAARQVLAPREPIAKGCGDRMTKPLIAAPIHIENPTGWKFADSVKVGYTQAPHEFNGRLFLRVIGWAIADLGALHRQSSWIGALVVDLACCWRG